MYECNEFKSSTPIYYHIDLGNDDYDTDKMRELISRISDLQLNLPVSKIIETGKFMLNKEVLFNKIQTRLYLNIKNRIDTHFSKCICVDYSHRKDVKIRPSMLISNNQNNRVYIFGSSGSGKSTQTAKLAIKWSKNHRGYNIFLFSMKTVDPVLDNLNNLEGINLIQVNLDKNFVSKHIQRNDNIDNYKDSLCIFDYCQLINDPIILKTVKHLKKNISQLSRLSNIDCISIQHKGFDNNESVIELAENNMIIGFPISNKCQIEKVLKIYCCIPKYEVEDILKNITSRWICFTRPNIYIDDTCVRIIE